MTVDQAIDRTDALCPNAYTREEKIQWILTLEGLVRDRIFATHENAPQPFDGDPSDGQAELSVPAPYDEIYPLFLQTRICYYDGELGRSAAAEERYRETWQAFRNRYNALHLPLSAQRKTV